MSNASSGNRKVIVVVGMHRSGTSLCMQVLQQLGVRVNDELLSADANNERGYLEDRNVVELNDQILGTLGVTWDTLFSAALPENWLENPALDAARKQLIDIVRDKAIGLPGTWGFKDPRLCVLLPLYDEVFSACGVDPHYVVCIRDPRAVALSLLRRNRFPRMLSELLWIDNTMRAVQAAGNRLKAVVHYERWFLAGREQLNSLLDGLELRGATSENSSTAILDTVAPALDHYDGTLGRYCLTWTDSIYRLLQIGDYAGAAAEFSDVREALGWGSPGRNTSRLCWRTDSMPFFRTTSSIVVTDLSPARRVVQLPFSAGDRLTGLRLDPASQPGIACFYALRLLSSEGQVLWEWDRRAATLEACERRSLAFFGRSSEPGAIAVCADSNASLVLPAIPDRGGTLEFDFSWLATSDVASSDAIAREFRSWRAELDALREECAQQKADVLRSWSWRLTKPLRIAGSFFMR
jgi:hypothetical protein